MQIAPASETFAAPRFDQETSPSAAPFACPACHSALTSDSGRYVCRRCERSFPIRGGIPSFASRAHYWNLLTEERMDVLLDIARDRGYRYAAEKILGAFA